MKRLVPRKRKDAYRANLTYFVGKANGAVVSRWALLSFVLLTSRTVHLELTRHKTRETYVRKKSEKDSARHYVIRMNGGSSNMQRQGKVRNAEKSEQRRARSIASSSPRGRRGAAERRYDRVPTIPPRICPPFRTFLPRKRYWPPPPIPTNSQHPGILVFVRIVR